MAGPDHASTRWDTIGEPSRAVALEVLLHGPVARSELARRLTLSPGSVTRLANPLVEGGLLAESDQPHHTPTGRAGRALEVVADAHHFVGVRLTEGEVAAVLTDMRADVVDVGRRPLPDTSPDSVTRAVADVVADLSAQAAVTAIGIGVGGQVAPDGSVLRAVFLGWEHVALADLLRDLTGIATHVENDVVALTTAEHWFGAGRGRPAMAMLTIGPGVGSGLVVHDRVVSTVDSGVGLLGHLPLGVPGPLCDRGHVGCAAAVLSDNHLVARASVALQRPVSTAELHRLAVEGSDPAVRRICTDLAVGLGRLIALVANTTQVPYVLVSGEGVDLAELFVAEIAAEVAAMRDPAAAPVEFDLHPLGPEEWARGGAAIAIQRFVSRDTPRSSRS